MCNQDFPRPFNVTLGRVHVADREAQRDALAQFRVRQEHFAGLVDEIEQPLVRGVQVRPAAAVDPPDST